jgi:predicted enzyme related to lactoylglutathione lyase
VIIIGKEVSHMDQKNNVVGWFEIPVHDMERAMKFYQTVFGLTLERHILGPLDMAWFPAVQNGAGAAGSLVHHATAYKPSTDGTLVYFTAHSGDLSQELARVEGAGGKVLLGKRLIKEDIGYMALLIDTEGNRIAMHSRK